MDLLVSRVDACGTDGWTDGGQRRTDSDMSYNDMSDESDGNVQWC